MTSPAVLQEEKKMATTIQGLELETGGLNIGVAVLLIMGICGGWIGLIAGFHFLTDGLLGR